MLPVSHNCAHNFHRGILLNLPLMDSVATARVNATLDRIRACVSTVANHSDVLRRAVSESTRVVQAMDKEIIASDTEFSKIFITELNDLQGMWG